MFRPRYEPRHRGDARRHGGVGEQLTICVLAVQISVAWLPSTQADPTEASEPAFHPPAVAGTAVPQPPIESQIEDPASLTKVDRARQVRETVGKVETVSTNGIPTAALAAYQRAAVVMNSADPGCHVEWQLIAAIGRVESDHGRYGGNVIDANGRSRPGIYGIALDGTRSALIHDTDAGRYDRDKVFDRAVGPMQFIPSTWSAVGVDADGDGLRDPQDIDDAALAAAVYLCSGVADLATDTGQRQAVYRYNHSQAYVDLVLAITAAYLEGDYTAVMAPIPTRQIVEVDEPDATDEHDKQPTMSDLRGVTITAGMLHVIDPDFGQHNNDHGSDQDGTDPACEPDRPESELDAAQAEDVQVDGEQAADAAPADVLENEAPVTDEQTNGDDVPPTQSDLDRGLECTPPDEEVSTPSQGDLLDDQGDGIESGEAEVPDGAVRLPD